MSHHWIGTPLQARLQEGMVIPACPLALTKNRTWDERRQRALLRYYHAAGAGGVALGVHTTQFSIRQPEVNLLRPLLELAAEEWQRWTRAPGSTATFQIGGVCGNTAQACAEASLLRDLGFHAGLLSLAALSDQPDHVLLRHCREVASIIPLFGFYLQPAVGGRLLSHSFWRAFVEIPEVVAIKIAPFDRYQSLDVLRAVAESGRSDIALYTGNDDNIVLDLLSVARFKVDGHMVEQRMVGGLLGHWAFWTRTAVQLLDRCKQLRGSHSQDIPSELLQQALEVTDINAAAFDAAHGFAGCIPGVHEMLRRSGLLESIHCLDPEETLSRGQSEEIGRVCAAYPHWNDQGFVQEHLDEWLQN